MGTELAASHLPAPDLEQRISRQLAISLTEQREHVLKQMIDSGYRGFVSFGPPQVSYEDGNVRTDCQWKLGGPPYPSWISYSLETGSARLEKGSESK